MRVISSQKHINWDILEAKTKQIEEECLEYVELPIVNAGIQDDKGEDLYVLVDGHHRKLAAESLGIEVRYIERENDYNATGTKLLEMLWNDCDYYYVDTEYPVW